VCGQSHGRNIENKKLFSTIQDLRSGKQTDIRVSNLIKIAKSFGYEVVLQKGEECLALHDDQHFPLPKNM